MILGADNQLACIHKLRRVPLTALAVFRIFSGEDISLLKGFRKLLDLAEITVVPGLFAGLEHMQGVMEIIIPLRMQPKTAPSLREQKAAVVQVTLGNQIDTAAMVLREFTNSRRQQREKWLSTAIDDTVYCVEP